MAGNIITEEESAQFRSLSVKKKVDSMELYLIGANGRRYNMQEVGAAVFGDANYSYTVSLIHRCYNFSGKNSGLYRDGCRFEQTYGYKVTRRDIEAFVQRYPNGTFRNGVTFEDFLRTRASAAQRAPAEQYGQPAQWDGQMDTAKMKSTMIIAGGIGALILLIMFLTGNLFKHWIIAIVVLLFTLGAFTSLKDL